MKTHLQAGKDPTRPLAMCASRAIGGKVHRNARTTYSMMGSPIVELQAFKAVPEADRCAHCCDVLLERRNRQRRDKGLAPVARYDEGWV